MIGFSLRRIGLPALVFAMAVGGLEAPARAQGTTATATAEALFAEGRRLAGEGKYAEACPKFEGAQKVAPTAGTQLNLADCYEKSGRLASAWASFRDAITMARAAGRAELVATAQKRASALEPRLPKLAITVTSTAAGLEIVRDGVAIPKEAWTTPVPIDPGEHVVEAKASAKKPLRLTVAAPAEGATATVNVPELEADPGVGVEPKPETTPSPGAPPQPPAPSQPAESTSSPGSTQRIVGLIVGGAGVVTAGVGGIFALQAISQNSDSKDHCRPENPNLCTGQGKDERDAALRNGNIATGLMIAGGVLAGAGVVIFFTAPTSANRVGVAPSPNGLLLAGRFQ
jgi:hypothetical protein